MSVGICGFVNYSSDNILEEINFSYFIMEQSIKWKLGCKLGGNISNYAYSVMEKDITKSIILIEIMDTPLDNYADEICQPTIDINNNSEFSVRQKLNINLDNFQEFLKSIRVRLRHRRPLLARATRQAPP